MRIAIGVVAVAAMVAGCTASSSNGPQQAADGKMLTYEVRSMTDFDAASSKAESACRSQYGGVAHYVDRTPGPNGDTVRFECV